MNTSNYLSDHLIRNRKHEVSRLIAFEQTFKVLIQELLISVQTVHAHRQKIMNELGVRNIAGLVRQVFANKFFLLVNLHN